MFEQFQKADDKKENKKKAAKKKAIEVWRGISEHNEEKRINAELDYE